MIDGYDSKSCNALQRPFYRPVEAALRWCNLTRHEGMILQSLGDDHIPKTGQFPQWPCLQATTEKILDAILHGEIPHGRDGKTVAAGDHVARPRLTVRHTDLREWMVKYHPGQKPPFLFDEIERNAHAAINADSYRALQADRDAARAELEKAKTRATDAIRELDAMRGERDSLRAMVNRMSSEKTEPTGKDRNTILRLIGGLAMAGWKMPIHERLNGIAEVVSDLSAVGVSVSEDTLRERLREAAQLIEPTKRY
jgi:hypothetical protein